jgi:hypothetical protein
VSVVLLQVLCNSYFVATILTRFFVREYDVDASHPAYPVVTADDVVGYFPSGLRRHVFSSRNDRMQRKY